MFKQLILALAAAATVSACSSTPTYEDPFASETVTIDFSTNDLLTLSGDMVNSLTQSGALVRYKVSERDDPRVVLVMAGVENRTSEHIDTSAITDEMRTQLLQSGRFRISSETRGQDAIDEQIRFQQGSGKVDPAQAKAYGRQIGADLVIWGTLRSIEKERGRSLESAGRKTELLDYQFVLTAADIETGEELWANSKYIRKREKRGIFGS
ncbi:MAG: penicillin-binding protein activator LpoB [Planctomycetota bacterium]